MTRRTYDDYSTFNWQDPWFVGDQDSRVAADGVILSGSLRHDAVSVDGLSELPQRSRAIVLRPVRPLGTPRIFIPPRS